MSSDTKQGSKKLPALHKSADMLFVFKTMGQIKIIYFLGYPFFSCYLLEQDNPRGTSVIFEHPHDKTNKMTLRPVKTQISLGMRPV